MLRQKAKNIIVSAFGTGYVSRDGINFSVSCPECDSEKEKKKLSIRLDDYRYHCWVCGIKGKSIWSFIARKKPSIQIDEALFRKPKSAHVEETAEEAVLSLPSKLVPVYRSSKDPDVLAVKNYLIKRGLTFLDIARWRIMTAKSGKFRRRALIPSFDSECNLNYYVARAIDDDQLNYINAKVPKKSVIFNDLDLDWTKPIVLVEGVFDAIKSIENSVPLLGSSLAKDSELYKKLMKNQSKVVVAIDSDLKLKGYKIAESLFEAGCKVRICFPPDGKDMGDLTKEENQKIIENAEDFSPYSSLTFKIRSIRSGSII
jgi:DNA primase